MSERDEVEAIVPQYLHRPFQLLFWESDELALIIIMITLASIGSSKILWLLTIVLPMTYSRMKKSYPRGFLKHMLYSLGFIKFSHYPNAETQRYFE